ncbi:MAG: hypothetical protein ABI890_06515, partial [Lapillicoccus sp.]
MTQMSSRDQGLRTVDGPLPRFARRRWAWRGAPVTALALAVGLLSSLGAHAGPGSLAAAAGSSTAAAATTGVASTSSILLPTGDRASVPAGTAGAADVTVDSPSGRDSTSFERGGDLYAVPSSAMAYLDHGVDARLFDVTVLGRTSPGASVPVRVQFRSAAKVLPPPGVTLTTTHGSVRDGLITAAGAPVFGAALDAAVARRAATPFGADVVSIDYRPSGVAPAASRSSSGSGDAAGVPAATQALTIHVLAADGGESTGFSYTVVNVDDQTAFHEVGAAAASPYTLQVPRGHYAVMVVAGPDLAYHVGFADTPVTGATTLVIDLAKATQRLQIDTPATLRAAPDRKLAVSWFRGSADAGVPVTRLEVNYARESVLFTPYDPQGGVSHLVFDTSRVSPPRTPGRAAFYHLDYVESGRLRATHHYVVDPAQLTVTTNRVASPLGVCCGAFVTTRAYLPWGTVTSVPLAVGFVFTSSSTSGITYGWTVDRMSAAPRLYAPGTTPDVDWSMFPPIPTFAAAGTGPWACQACRVNDRLILTPYVGDSEPDHYAVDDESVGYYWTTFTSLSFDGHLLTSQKNTQGLDLTVPAGPHRFRLVQDRMTGNWLPQPTTHSVWTFASDTSTTTGVPSNWSCLGTTGVDSGAGCSPVDLMQVTWHVAQNLRGMTTPTAGVDLGIAHS